MQSLFDYTKGMQSILLFSTALIFSLVCTPFIKKFAIIFNLYDAPQAKAERYKSLAASDGFHKSPVPRLGGICFVGGFFVSMLLWFFPSDIGNILVFSIIFFLLGFVDDLHPLSARFRLLCQVSCAAMTVFMGGLSIKFLSLTTETGIHLHPVFGYILSVFIIVGAINSINMIDGMDGLAGGIAIIGSVTLSYLHFLISDNLEVAFILSIPLLGAVLGFLKYNTYPASIFMGDGGSNWLGFILGVQILLVLGGGMNAAPAHGIHVPVISAALCLGVPIVDTAWVIFNRIAKGVSPFTPDARHFHHILLKHGLNTQQAVTVIYFTSLLFAVSGIIPVAFPHEHLWIIAYLAFFALCALLGTTAWSSPMISRLFSRDHFFFAFAHYSQRTRAILRLWESMNRYIIYAILCITPLFASSSPEPVGYSAVAMIVLLLISAMFSYRSASDFFPSFVLALSSSVLLTANNLKELYVVILGHSYNIHFLYNYLFIFLAVSVILFIIFSFRRQYLLVTATDFLMITLPLLFLLVPDPYREAYRLNTISIRSLILFIAIRSVIRRYSRSVFKIRLVTLIALTYISLKGLLGMRFLF
ncbi:MAG: undecaprenyl/decaprenyl-phosphate alpha-N-acetylglucosaminyl 1-phosphate transferase [Deltaproteobacteria bacterium]|nr:undecaprenyl/decaprenyl-phosphate alpha-N-acetylglucosaminyl 1-phosphate transferase [Deltaproteobacteria bacterium]